jgi:hypothetical protein
MAGELALADALKHTADALERIIALDPRDEPARRIAVAKASWILAQLRKAGVWR